MSFYFIFVKEVASLIQNKGKMIFISLCVAASALNLLNLKNVMKYELKN